MLLQGFLNRHRFNSDLRISAEDAPALDSGFLTPNHRLRHRRALTITE